MYGYIYKFTDMFINKEPSTSIWIFEQVSIQPMEMYSFLLARYTNNNIICTITIIYNKITIIFTKGILARYTKTMIDPRLMVKFMIIFTKRNCWVPHFFNTMITLEKIFLFVNQLLLFFWFMRGWPFGTVEFDLEILSDLLSSFILLKEAFCNKKIGKILRHFGNFFLGLISLIIYSLHDAFCKWDIKVGTCKRSDLTWNVHDLELLQMIQARSSEEVRPLFLLKDFKESSEYV